MAIHYEYGKIQYIQEKQGFIRCNRRVNGKRDIIFFRDETNMSIRNELKLGMIVRFAVASGTKTNIKGGIITHWAVINGIVDKRQDTRGIIMVSPRDNYSTLSSDSEEISSHCSLERNDYSENEELPTKCILSFLLGDVYKQLYNKDLTSNPNGLRNCWQV